LPRFLRSLHDGPRFLQILLSFFCFSFFGFVQLFPNQLLRQVQNLPNSSQAFQLLPNFSQVPQKPSNFSHVSSQTLLASLKLPEKNFWAGVFLTSSSFLSSSSFPFNQYESSPSSSSSSFQSLLLHQEAQVHSSTCTASFSFLP